MIANHCFQFLPVLARTASSLIRGAGFELTVFMSVLLANIKRGFQRQAEAYRTSFRVALVGDGQPMFHFVVDIVDRGDRNALGNPILFSKATSVDQPSGWFHISQRKAKINAGLGCWFDLRKDV